MAYRKSRKKGQKKTSRRRRMSGMGSNVIMQALGLVAGAAAGRIVSSSSKILPNIDSKIKNAGVVALGVFLPKFVKNPISASVGAGMIAVGGLGLLQSTGVIGAIEDSMELPVSVMAGDDLSVIAGYSSDNLSVIAGDYSDEMF
jgi:hypothetical protein